APADLRHFLAHADDALHPIEQGVWVAPLFGGVHMLEPIRPTAYDRKCRVITLREAAVRLVRPLHRRTRAGALGQRKIITHAELIAITQHRRSGQREHEAVRKLDAAAVA